MLETVRSSFNSSATRHLTGRLLVCLAPLAAALSIYASEPDEDVHAAGRKIYLEHCARCHGETGQGNPEEYDEPLFGDRSAKSLAGLITRTMPEDEPEAVSGDAAQQVAAFIFDAFYSPDARDRIAPAPRIELARLTVSQYRNSLADLVATFLKPIPEESRASREGTRGLAAQYFQSKGMSKANNLELERVDAEIDFDFAEGSPAVGITADQFAGIWSGSLVADTTGHYEFRVTTQNGVRLYVNAENTGQRRRLRDDSSVAGQSALIDGWVSSGAMREHEARIFLLGGRLFPIRLEFFKYKEATASVRLEWKPPHGTWSLLDARFTRTGSAPRTFAPDVPFPADDRSVGYERGTSVSTGWHDGVTRGAIATATEVIDRLPILAGIKSKDTDRAEKTAAFIKQIANRAFRRPLTMTEKQLLGGPSFENPDNPETGLRRAILFVLTSPQFLYLNHQTNETGPEPHTVASRLSYALWDSLPDAQLTSAAAAGKLRTKEHIRHQVSRMLADPRTQAKIRGFFRHWLELEDRDLNKDQQRFPEFDEAVVSDLRYSLESFIDEVVWSGASDYRDLLLADHVLLNNRLAPLYAPNQSPSQDPSDLPQSATQFTPIPFTGQRAGILTHPYLLSAYSYHDTTSPIHRGVFLTRNVMGRGLKPPPKAVAFKNEEFPEHLSMREKITHLTRDAACMTCHSVINPLGFALENFDAVGRWRTNENDQPIDTRSDYTTLQGDQQIFQSARDIAEYAVTSQAAQRAFVYHLFHHLIKQPPRAYGSEIPDDLRLHFEQENFSILKLVSEIAVTTATYHHDSKS